MTERKFTLPPSPHPDHYSLAQVAIMFHSPPGKIKARCVKGQFDYIVDGGGRTWITRESILKHLHELEIKNNK
jgi:hypothetical protein